MKVPKEMVDRWHEQMAARNREYQLQSKEEMRQNWRDTLIVFAIAIVISVIAFEALSSAAATPGAQPIQSK